MGHRDVLKVTEPKLFNFVMFLKILWVHFWSYKRSQKPWERKGVLILLIRRNDHTQRVNTLPSELVFETTVCPGQRYGGFPTLPCFPGLDSLINDRPNRFWDVLLYLFCCYDVMVLAAWELSQRNKWTCLNDPAFKVLFSDPLNLNLISIILPNN